MVIASFQAIKKVTRFGLGAPETDSVRLMGSRRWKR